MLFKHLSISLLVLLGACCAVSAEVEIKASSPASLSVVVSAGQVEMPNGKTVDVAETMLNFAEPKTENKTATVKVPHDVAGWIQNFDPWAGRGKGGITAAVGVGPSHDKKGVPILGSLLNGVIINEVKSEDGTKTFVEGQDYIVNQTWGQILAKGGKLGEYNKDKLSVSYTIVSQRIDLVQVDSSGKVSVKKGESEWVCPMIPQADSGCKALCGIYINPKKREGKWVVAKDDIYPINPAAPVELINPQALSKTLEKLRNGQNVNIGLMGDSITLGAEACQWWKENEEFTAKDLTYRGRFIYGLTKLFPKATIKPIKAYKGGSTTKYGVDIIQKNVVPGNPDLVTIAFGVNDSTSAVGAKPRVDPEDFRKYITDMVKTCKGIGSEVIIITSLQPSPFLRNEHAKRYAALAQILREIGVAENVAVADVYSEWMNMATRGIPPYTQLHNGINHGGDYGHKLYSDMLLRFFEQK